MPWIGAAHPRGGGGITGAGQRVGHPFGGVRHGTVIVGIHALDPVENGLHAATREVPDSLVAADLPQLPHRGGRQIVVGVLELGSARCGQPVALGRPAAAGLLPGSRRVGLGIAAVDEGIEMPANTGGRDTEVAADLRGRDRAGFQQELHDGAAGVAVLRRAPAARVTRPAGFSQHQCVAITPGRSSKGTLTHRRPLSCSRGSPGADRVLWWPPASIPSARRSQSGTATSGRSAPPERP